MRYLCVYMYVHVHVIGKVIVLHRPFVSFLPDRKRCAAAAPIVSELGAAVCGWFDTARTRW